MNAPATSNTPQPHPSHAWPACRNCTFFIDFAITADAQVHTLPSPICGNPQHPKDPVTGLYVITCIDTRVNDDECGRTGQWYRPKALTPVPPPPEADQP